MRLLFCITLLLTCVAARANGIRSYPERLAGAYEIGRLAPPPGINPQIGGIATLHDGRLAVAFHHGEVAICDPKDGTWKTFAEGLHEPLGILEESPGTLLVMQRPELTRLRDTNGDGVADQYETVWDDYGITGNYHEFAFGPVRGPNGKFYVSLNLASEGASIRPEIRGEFNKWGPAREKFYTPDWRAFAKREVIGMYSPVRWRGWVMEIDEKSGRAEPFASGFRSPDGIGFDADDHLIIVDQQGDWRGTNEVHVVERDGFYGHPASLAWRKDWNGPYPVRTSIEKLNEFRTRPAICIPYETYGASPTQPVTIPKTKEWGPFGGQLVVGEMNFPRLFRLMLENVGGVWQGACALLAESEELKGGLHRIAFVGSTLYVGRIHLAWAGGEGISSLKRVSEMPFEIATMKATQDGFRFEFTRPLAESAREAAHWKGQRYFYLYRQTYGSPKMEKADVAAQSVSISSDGRSAAIVLPGIKAGFVYDFDLAELRSSDGEPILNPKIAYTLNRLPAK